MKTIRFAGTDERVSKFCLGTMMFGERCDEQEADRIIGTAIDGGINFIDTAAMYAKGYNEEILGRILQGRRDKLFITTKVHKGVDAASIENSIGESLGRMKTEHADLYMIHWPQAGMKPIEMMQALNNAVQRGQTRYVGFCNCPAWLFAHMNMIAEENGWAKLVCNQVPYNVIERGIEVEVLPQALTEKIAITVYRALVIGLLTGKYVKGQELPENVRGTTDARIPAWLDKFGDSLARLQDYADELDVQMTQLAIAWVNHNPGVTSPILGVSSVRQLEALLKGFSFELTQEQYDTISGMFDTEVKEEAGGKFPALRRDTGLVSG